MAYSARWMITCALALASAMLHAEPAANGDAWRGWDDHTRRGYVAGALDGAELGATVAVFGCNLQADDDQQRACNKATIGAYRNGRQRYLQPVAPEQLIQGLDALYSDPLNRVISLKAGLQAVVYQLGGLPDPQSLIEAYRRP